MTNGRSNEMHTLLSTNENLLIIQRINKNHYQYHDIVTIKMNYKYYGNALLYICRAAFQCEEIGKQMGTQRREAERRERES